MKNMSLDEWVSVCHGLSREKGWYETGFSLPEKVALIHSEISEALECYREGKMETTVAANGKPEGFWTEIADVVIRCFDLAGALAIGDDSHRATKLKRGSYLFGVDKIPERLAFLHEETSGILRETFEPNGTKRDFSGPISEVINASFALAGDDKKLWAAIEQKHIFNKTREHRHGGKRC